MSQEDAPQDDRSRIEKVKQHLKENKKVYLAAAGGVVVGGTAVGIFALRSARFQTPEIQQAATNNALLNWKPSPSNTVITMTAEHHGHPGNATMCLETLEKFSSQSRAAAAEGVSNHLMHRHLSGELPHINGRHFVKTGEHSVRR